MKPDEQQRQWLRGYLRAVLKYHETYHEVYDHVLLALENRSHEQFFETEVMAIITEDFGGLNGLLKMQRDCKNAVISELRKQYRQHFFSFFRYPMVIYTALIAVITTYIALHFSVKVLVLAGSTWTTCALMAPVLLLAARKLKLFYQLDTPKRMLKDNILGTMVSQPFRLLIGWFIFLNVPFYISPNIHRLVNNFWMGISPLICAAVTIHAISFIRIIKHDFKVRVLR